nr:retrotransposon protein, putative, Ty1-copia subclass [Tanacetum cinerariifolium]
MMGYYFYFPSKNKIVVARYVEFFEKNLLSQEVSGRVGDLKEIQNEDTSPSEITSEIPIEVEGFEPPQEEEALVRSKKRIEKLQQDGLLKSTDDESFDQCASCLSGKMTRKSFPHRLKRATDVLGLIHTDVCRPLRHVSRQ